MLGKLEIHRYATRDLESAARKPGRYSLDSSQRGLSLNGRLTNTIPHQFTPGRPVLRGTHSPSPFSPQCPTWNSRTSLLLTQLVQRPTNISHKFTQFYGITSSSPLLFFEFYLIKYAALVAIVPFLPSLTTLPSFLSPPDFNLLYCE